MPLELVLVIDSVASSWVSTGGTSRWALMNATDCVGGSLETFRTPTISSRADWDDEDDAVEDDDLVPSSFMVSRNARWREDGKKKVWTTEGDSARYLVATHTVQSSACAGTSN